MTMKFFRSMHLLISLIKLLHIAIKNVIILIKEYRLYSSLKYIKTYN